MCVFLTVGYENVFVRRFNTLGESVNFGNNAGRVNVTMFWQGLGYGGLVCSKKVNFSRLFAIKLNNVCYFEINSVIVSSC